MGRWGCRRRMGGCVGFEAAVVLGTLFYFTFFVFPFSFLSARVGRSGKRLTTCARACIHPVPKLAIMPNMWEGGRGGLISQFCCRWLQRNQKIGLWCSGNINGAVELLKLRYGGPRSRAYTWARLH